MLYMPDYPPANKHNYGKPSFVDHCPWKTIGLPMSFQILLEGVMAKINPVPFNPNPMTTRQVDFEPAPDLEDEAAKKDQSFSRFFWPLVRLFGCNNDSIKHNKTMEKNHNPVKMIGTPLKTRWF
jgi:hypothetical protein